MDGLIDMKNKIKFPLAFTHGPQLIHHAFDDVFRCFLVILSSRDFYYQLIESRLIGDVSFM